MTDDRPIIDMTEENQLLIEALMRVAANPWPHRDEDAEQTLLDAIQELVKLRKENAALNAENEYQQGQIRIQREIVQFVAAIGQDAWGKSAEGGPWSYYCPFCLRTIGPPADFRDGKHAADCPTLKARALLAT